LKCGSINRDFTEYKQPENMSKLMGQSNSKRKALKKLYNRNKNQEKILLINKKSDYELSELITAGIAMFLFKEDRR